MRKGSRIAALLLVLCLLMGCNDAPALAVVPDVTEASTEVAVSVLTQQGFIPVVKETADPTAPVGVVLRTDPPAGSYVAVGGKVYLFVAAAPTATTASPSPSSTAVPPSTTALPHSTTTAVQTSTSLHSTATGTSLSATTTNPCAAGHRYADGICGVCGAADPHFVQTLAVGQIWTVENQWSFSILDVTYHDLCTLVNNDVEHYADQQVILIRYAYANLGFVSDFDHFVVDGMSFTVTQDDGAAVTAYSCGHKQLPTPCAMGESCTAEETYALDKNCRRITLLVSLRTSNGKGIRQVQFDIPLP